MGCCQCILGISEADSEIEPEDEVPIEPLESDMELKLHIMGSKQLWTESWTYALDVDSFYCWFTYSMGC